MIRAVQGAIAIILLAGCVAAQEMPAQPKCSAEGQQDCIKEPLVRKQVTAKYTKKAEKAGIEGRVVLLCTVGVDGRAHDIKVAHSLGAGLDESAVKALEKWRFRPATLNGKPVPYQVSIETLFSLPNES
jgi:TonB family protein